MIIHQGIIQGSPEWHALRAEHFCASEATQMMGVSPYGSRDDLLALKTGHVVREETTDSQKFIFAKGHKAEDDIRPFVNSLFGETMFAATGTNGKYLASFDGINMLETELWEHKLFNAKLAKAIAAEELPETHYWQLEHQCLVAESDSVVFMISDGTEENEAHCTYTSKPERRKQLIAGWEQFEKDMITFKPKAKVEKVVGESGEGLPAVVYKVEGSLITSNIIEILPAIELRAKQEMERELSTDQDFADKDTFNKAVKTARADLKSIVEDAKNEFTSFSDFSGAAAQMDTILQKLQSHGEKQVKTKKDDLKAKIIADAQVEICTFNNQTNEIIKPVFISQVINSNLDYAGAMKGKRTITSWHSAVNDLNAAYKIQANELIEHVLASMEYINQFDDYKFLFADLNNLVLQSSEALEAIVTSRIDQHKALEAQKEAQRVEAENAAQALAEEANVPPAVKTDDIEPQLNDVQPSDANEEEKAITLADELNDWANRHCYEHPSIFRDLKAILTKYNVDLKGVA